MNNESTSQLPLCHLFLLRAPCAPRGFDFDVFLQRPRADFRPIDVTLSIGRHAFRRACPGARPRVRVRLCVWNEGRDLAVAREPDPDAALPARISSRVRLRIGHINDVALINENSARPAELLPLFEEFSILVEDLDAVIIPVADEEPAF